MNVAIHTNTKSRILIAEVSRGENLTGHNVSMVYTEDYDCGLVITTPTCDFVPMR